MKVTSKVVGLLAIISAFAHAQSQTQTTTPAGTVVPRLVSYSGIVKGGSGKPISGQVSITFSLYSEQQGGTPLWSEMQAVQADAEGRYSVFLGAANGSGLPLEVFTSGTARWLAVRPDVPGVEDPARILLVGVPYALKAADADTLGGKPASAFVTTESQLTPEVVTGSGVAPLSPIAQGVTSDANPTGTGTTNYIPLWTSSSNLGNSLLYQSGNNIGIGTTAPPSPLTLSSLGNTFASGVSYLADFIGAGVGNNSGTTNYRGLDFNITAAGATAIQGFTSVTGDNFNSLNTGTVGTQTIFSGNLRVNNGGNTTSGYGFQVIPILSSTGGITTWEAFDARTPSIASGGAGISKAYGVYVEPQKVTGVTTAYGLYQGGTSDLNYLAGKVGIGTASPGANLEVNGTAKFDGAVTFAGNQTDTGNVTTSGELISTVGTGTAPLQVTSTTQVANLNASYLGGYSSGSYAFVAGSNTFSAANTFGVFTTFNDSLTAVNSSTSSYGITGTSTATTSGIYGIEVGASITGESQGSDAGVWGDTSVAGGTGITATADDGWAGYFANNAADYPGLYVNNAGTNLVANLIGPNGSCSVDMSGNLACTGSKSAVVPVDNGTKKVALYAVEAPENWFEDFGAGQLAGGVATVTLESTFIQTVNTGVDYHVFITPKGESKGLYVSNETAQGFEVHEVAGGQSNIAFDYRIVARRKGYESIRLADRTKDFDSTKRPKHAVVGNQAARPKSALTSLNRQSPMAQTTP